MKAGGLNGRPERSDVCYSWWVLGLGLCDRLAWIDQDALAGSSCGARTRRGGIADRPDDEPDVYTFFGLAGLSLMGFPGLKKIDPARAARGDVRRLGLYSDERTSRALASRDD